MAGMNGAAFGNLVDVTDRVTGEIHKIVKSKRYREDPALWSKEYLGIDLWSKQREISESVRDNHNTAVAAGHGVGKSFVASIIAAWWADVHPVGETFIASTAPSVDQIAIIWDGIRRVHGLAKQRYEDGIVDHPLPGYITGDNKWKLPDGTLLGQGRKPPDNKSDVAFQGQHARYLLAIGDEAVQPKGRARRIVTAGLETGDLHAQRWGIDPDGTGWMEVEGVTVRPPMRGAWSRRCDAGCRRRAPSRSAMRPSP